MAKLRGASGVARAHGKMLVKCLNARQSDTKFMKYVFWCALALLWLAAGCAEPEYNRLPTISESDCLSDVAQLTSGFSHVGHAYLSPDMSWLIFQACDSPDGTYQVYLAQVRYSGDNIAGIFSPIRITPTPSRNGCG